MRIRSCVAAFAVLAFAAMLTSACSAAKSPGSPASTEESASAPALGPTAETSKLARKSSPPLIVGMSEGNLVVYDPVKGARRALVRDVGSTGVLVLGPSKDWVAIERPRRWDGLDTLDVIFANLKTKKIWRLSKQAHREIHVAPISWKGDTVVYADSSAYPGNLTVLHTYAFDLRSGAITLLGKADDRPRAWSSYSKTWSAPLRVPNPKMPPGMSCAPHFWHLGQADVSPNGEWAVAWLQPDWPAPTQTDWFPVYLLSRDGTYRRLPLQRPVAFLETLVGSR